MRTKEFIEELEKLELHNKVYEDVRENILNYIDITADDVDLECVFHDLVNTQGGSWLIYNSEIISYFDNNKDAIDEILFDYKDELNIRCSSMTDLITQLVYSAYEKALFHVIYDLI